MKWSFESVGVIGFCLIGLTILFLFGVLTINNESDYYNLKETTEAAMLESIDIAYYRDTGELKLVQERFVENFIKRFTATVGFGTSGYNIIFEDIIERPVKVSIVISSSTGDYQVMGDTSSYEIKNKIDAVLEYSPRSPDSPNTGRSGEGTPKKWVEKTMTVTYTSMPYGGYADGKNVKKGWALHVNKYIPDELDECLHSDIRNVRFKEFASVKPIKSYALLAYHVRRYTTVYQYTGNFGNMNYWNIASDINIGPSGHEYIAFTDDLSAVNGIFTYLTPAGIRNLGNYTGNLFVDCDNEVTDEIDRRIKDVHVIWRPESYNCPYNQWNYFSADPVSTEYDNNGNPTGKLLYSQCVVPIAYDIVYSYEQYE